MAKKMGLGRGLSAILPDVEEVVESVDQASEGAAPVPADAVAEGDGWRFEMPRQGIEPLLAKLLEAGHGIAGLTIERPGLHEAFVRIVGEANAEREKVA